MKNANSKQNKKVITPKKKEIVNPAAKPEVKEESLERKTRKARGGLIALKHKMVFNSLVQNVSKCKRTNSVYQAMIDAGYSHSYARSCTNMTETKDWIKLTEKYLPDNLLATTHNDLMIARKLEYTLFDDELSVESITDIIKNIGCTPIKIIKGRAGVHCYYYAPDNKIRKDATDMAYKVKGKMAPEKFEVEQTGLQSLSDEDLAALIKKQKARFTKQD